MCRRLPRHCPSSQIGRAAHVHSCRRLQLGPGRRRGSAARACEARGGCLAQQGQEQTRRGVRASLLHALPSASGAIGRAAHVHSCRRLQLGPGRRRGSAARACEARGGCLAQQGQEQTRRGVRASLLHALPSASGARRVTSRALGPDKAARAARAGAAASPAPRGGAQRLTTRRAAARPPSAVQAGSKRAAPRVSRARGRRTTLRASASGAEQQQARHSAAAQYPCV